MVSLLEGTRRQLSRAARRQAAVLAAAAVALALGPLLAASADAGEFHLYSCRTPSGAAAPADGWSPSHSGPYTYAEDTCAQSGGALVAALRPSPGRTADTDVATWEFSAPAPERIAAATLWRAGDADGGAAINASYQFWFAGPENVVTNPAFNFGQCEGGLLCPYGLGNSSQPLATENRIGVPGPNLGSRLFVNASCVGAPGYQCPEGQADANGYAAVVNVYAVDLTLAQDAGPTADNVGGELASAPVLRGTSDVTFSASDPASGVYEALFSIDGQLVQSSVVDANGGRCANVGGTSDGLAAFLYAQPCKASVSADVGFDTTQVASGEHHLVVSVIDAAGNSAAVLDRQVKVLNEPLACQAPTGASASGGVALSASWRGTHRQVITSAFGRRRTIDGRLTSAAGAPIAGAPVELVAAPVLARAKPLAVASARTGPDGRFSVRVRAAGPSRTLCLTYRGASGIGSPVATRKMTLRVRAGVVLHVTPRVASVGRSIRFIGRLRSGPVPPGGKQLVLEARAPGGAWLEFKVVRTNARGRFHAGYRFRFPGPARYQFRVLCEPESGYPFAGGASNVVRVFER